jgi:hypothetical protein
MIGDALLCVTGNVVDGARQQRVEGCWKFRQGDFEEAGVGADLPTWRMASIARSRSEILASISGSLASARNCSIVMSAGRCSSSAFPAALISLVLVRPLAASWASSSAIETPS